ncbi:MAG: hypothetical protein IPL28_08420 [Chloroflexi bacterium]|nr:hypothetical protein [Chloroflexota bacterium]
MAGAEWQIVSQQTQAENMVGRTPMRPKIGRGWAAIGFNLNFNLAGYYDECEQMRFYSVAGRPPKPLCATCPKHMSKSPPS